MTRHLPHWMTYEAEVQEAPARITADLAFFDRERRPLSHTALCIIGTSLNDPDISGLGTPAEQASIDRATHALRQAIIPLKIEMAGSFTAAGTWQALLYTPPQLDEALIPAADTIFERENWTRWIHAEPDPTWQRYDEFLLPPTADRLTSLNTRSTQSLIEATHDLSIPRRVTHTLSFPSPEAAELTLSTLTLLGFELSSPPRAITED